MAREISRAEAWERAHEIFTQVNFNAFDYISIKESLLDYVKLYFPEDFNDYIESSEFIAILELFAYVGELLAYRIDLNAHENFITTAQRKESILRLAKLISYKASRNIAGRGLVKMTSISTTETIIDSAGRNLAGRRIYWNDTNNPDWKEQFLLIINRILEQEFGSVTPDERVQVADVLFELYTMNNNPFGTKTAGRLPFTASASGTNAPMEVVPIELTADGPIERRPERDAKFSLVYANDGLGDSSDTTGFLMFVKQGQLNVRETTFDGVTPNQTYEIAISDINETDLWLNNVDSGTTRELLTVDPYEDLMPHLVSDDLRYGEWIEVDLANAQNIIFNTNRNRHKYEVETLDDDQLRIIFGDGEFSDIPSGSFDIWFRTSLNQDYVIEKTAVIDQSSSVAYTDINGSVQTLTFTFSLVSSIQNASASEDIEHIRRVAPSVYYTQDRMVNARDYNVFMLQDPTILKLRSVNRTFAGDSKYITWHDPSDSYENVKVFGDDLALYWRDQSPMQGNIVTAPISTTSLEILSDYIEPLLATSDFYLTIAPLLQALGQSETNVRTSFYTGDITDPNYKLYTFANTFGDNERDAILYALDNIGTNFDLHYSASRDEWTVGVHPLDPQSLNMITIESGTTTWNIMSRIRRLVAQSSTTKFWVSDQLASVIDFDTLNTNSDRVVILQANPAALSIEQSTIPQSGACTINRWTGILDSNRDYVVVGREMIDSGTGNLPDVNRVSVLPEDTNDDGIPDNVRQADIFLSHITGEWENIRQTDDGGMTYYIDIGAYGKSINNSTAKGLDNDITVQTADRAFTFSNQDLLVNQTDPGVSTTITKIYVSSAAAIEMAGATVMIELPEFVYFYRDDAQSPWNPVADTPSVRQAYISETVGADSHYDRALGRFPLNFAWFHYTPNLNLIDPAASNIIDTFIITKGYYTSMTRWLEGVTNVEPSEPLPLDLRSSYADLMDNKMISDTLVLHSGKFKILFGSKADPQLRATFKVVRPERTSKTDNQIKVEMASIIRSFFDIESWEFGETFFFTELAASIHASLGPEIDTVLLVPLYQQNQFGDLFQVASREDEVFIPDISTSDIEIIESLTDENLRIGVSTST